MRSTTHLRLQPLQIQSHLNVSRSAYHPTLSKITNSLTALGSTRHQMPITCSLIMVHRSHLRTFQMFSRHLNLAKAHRTRHLTNQDIPLPQICQSDHLVLVHTVLESLFIPESQDRPGIVKDVRRMTLMSLPIRYSPMAFYF